ncbi:hypothetical protein PR048_018605 [Dryococelus australis]|uniref:Integrase catalytic domain-containing protein n=1 Tax=Dryococelus australis TaxID=614101 RepID=A0ABQ9HCR4_9NEOP|nr:hypothetical protein PR048_018605 [Dryococelus australis]
MRIRLQAYDLDIEYKLGKEIFIADALSRESQGDKEIGLSEQENFTKSRMTTMFQNNNTKETLIIRDIPTRAWKQVYIDIFEFQACTYLLLTDASTRYTEVRLLKDLTGKTEVDNIMSIFAVNGIPDIVYTDQGLHFVNKDFKKFATDWYFSLITNSPTYSQSNGLVERHVQTIKCLFKKVAQNRGNIYLALLDTAIEPGLPSPSQLLNSRRLRGLAPMSESAKT